MACAASLLPYGIRSGVSPAATSPLLFVDDRVDCRPVGVVRLPRALDALPFGLACVRSTSESVGAPAKDRTERRRFAGPRALGEEPDCGPGAGSTRLRAAGDSD